MDNSDFLSLLSLTFLHEDEGMVANNAFGCTEHNWPQMTCCNSKEVPVLHATRASFLVPTVILFSTRAISNWNPCRIASSKCCVTDSFATVRGLNLRTHSVDFRQCGPFKGQNKLFSQSKSGVEATIVFTESVRNCVVADLLRGLCRNCRETTK